MGKENNYFLDTSIISNIIDGNIIINEKIKVESLFLSILTFYEMAKDSDFFKKKVKIAELFHKYHIINVLYGDFKESCYNADNFLNYGKAGIKKFLEKYSDEIISFYKDEIHKNIKETLLVCLRIVAILKLDDEYWNTINSPENKQINLASQKIVDRLEIELNNIARTKCSINKKDLMTKVNNLFKNMVLYLFDTFNLCLKEDKYSIEEFYARFNIFSDTILPNNIFEKCNVQINGLEKIVPCTMKLIKKDFEYYKDDLWCINATNIVKKIFEGKKIDSNDFIDFNIFLMFTKLKEVDTFITADKKFYSMIYQYNQFKNLFVFNVINQQTSSLIDYSKKDIYLIRKIDKCEISK